ncbi:aspartate aminotransferase family protein [Anabaena cylindrica FACHB-243]|uniref:Glutamate-1-semialdehyde 2,1-aminomutase n=1 Tax=Anabaena cylindrica (strain ATCC 27899 / PCC 7122) TaxID=272123 RepID=K9ZQZ7_ANACC|nr:MULTISPECIES: aspartate aminotransferase family protein [Anabaena]AFZ60770.1 Glutamate-1-semialdehyde 2,1-aminomutase [Anabaena cylindrica PCC 7122]MBD2419795.1 aspartate aminotransferase family protein [Anabaena cylindrica FACHB-243]MBY5281344.1 aspartate aminotransferase family protein [Anabaena sp. CCAP 1446/1C]MBY5309007.1 aspartate aminotransferase family protein [Anabaena sp. CCAP 1446/1C]MCM2406770.1 aspartate aminotransferase family protein [Anabaena sp. CCAP 1446/1C]
MQVTTLDMKQQHLTALIERYTKRTQTSKQMTQAYRPLLADPRVPDWFNLSTKEMCYLIVGKKSKGSRIWDIDNNEYVDIIMGFGANLLGHNPQFIQEAIIEQLEKGIPLGPQSEVVGEVAKLISEMTGMERVAFSNTGTEAVMTAIRLARAATKRNKIVIFSGAYHGHFDGTLAKAQTNKNPEAVPITPGVLPGMIEDVLILDYGSSQSLEIIKTYQDELAAVLVEPIQTRRPDLQPQEFLQQLRQLTQKSGITLIFDEMITGFRLHLGGAQSWFGVEADIATYGKVVGGGMPIGVIAGKATYMDKIDGGMWNYGDTSSPEVERTFFAGTHCKHPLSMAAAWAVLKYLKLQGSSLQAELNQRTSQYVERLNVFFAAKHLPIRMANFGSFFGPVFREEFLSGDVASIMMGLDLLRYHLFDRGVLLRGEGGGFLSTSHTDEDVDYIVQAMKDSINEIQAAGFLP